MTIFSITIKMETEHETLEEFIPVLKDNFRNGFRYNYEITKISKEKDK